MTESAAPGRLHGIGVGPGDPELMTVKAVRTLQGAPIVAYFAKDGQRSHARRIVERWIDGACEEMPLAYPLTTEIALADPRYGPTLCSFYDAAAAAIAARLCGGQDVALLCEGDPLFYGSFMHIYVRLKDRFAVSVCPGVTGMAGCWAAASQPMVWGDDVLTVLPGTLPGAILAERLAASDAAVIMKLGKNLAKVRSAVAAAGLTQRAIYVERGTTAEEVILPLRDKHDDEAPYFALVLVPARGGRRS
ncbi:MAG: precorrin-2 C(20)-methyltransferase [Methylobacteriaceae bacterium]|nr:precorrin-2 C(20)-methyltransferase [Methylobacteriaceae bacterium]MBV9633929.1 precorrin-2 C(20)-methyltransferase [Methylobacteriaceae bacterium]MBV9705642.1 precorrin-2 C(20)-methyltransferase [Methylobacteriaceae bacterium]